VWLKRVLMYITTLGDLIKDYLIENTLFIYFSLLLLFQTSVYFSLLSRKHSCSSINQKLLLGMSQPNWPCSSTTSQRNQDAIVSNTNSSQVSHWKPLLGIPVVNNALVLFCAYNHAHRYKLDSSVCTIAYKQYITPVFTTVDPSRILRTGLWWSCDFLSQRADFSGRSSGHSSLNLQLGTLTSQFKWNVCLS
jgi:hypothetical protein